MAFKDLLTNTSADDIKKEQILEQALRRREYNRKYQAKLREVAKTITLEKKIDANLDHVIGYIKTKYAKEYREWVKPVDKSVGYPEFNNWLLLSASEYKTPKYAYEISGLSIDYKVFAKLFNQYYKKNNSGNYIKV